MTEWTTPYCGLSHYGESKDARRITVDDRGVVVFLKKWWRGCGFSPEIMAFNDIATAKAVGEHWVKQRG